MQEALRTESRYPHEEGEDARRAYFDRILPAGVEKGNAMLPDATEIFACAYPARLEEYARPPLLEQDVRMLSLLMRQGYTPAELQEAYFGHSLYRTLMQDETAQNLFESNVFSAFMEKEQRCTASELSFVKESFAQEMQNLREECDAAVRTHPNGIPYTEGLITAILLIEDRFSAYTMQRVLLEESVCTGDDEQRQTYAEKLVAQALQVRTAYDRLSAAPSLARAENVDELYAAMLYEALQNTYDGLLDDTSEERLVAELVTEGFAQEEVAAAVERHSPFLYVPARDKEAYLDNVLHRCGQGKKPCLGDAKKAYVTAQDLYRHRILAHDRLLHAQGKSIARDDPDACGRIARQLIAEKKATRDELKDLLRAAKSAREEHPPAEKKEEERAYARST